MAVGSGVSADDAAADDAGSNLSSNSRANQLFLIALWDNHNHYLVVAIIVRSAAKYWVRMRPFGY